MAYTPVPADSFVVPGSTTGFLDVRRIGTTSPVVTILVPALVGLPPTITGINPTTGVAGSTVVLTGTNFTGATLVSINNGLVASFAVNSATQITATLSSVQSTGRIRVTTPNGTATSTIDFVVQVPDLPNFSLTLAGEQDTANSQYPASDGTLTWSSVNNWLLKYNSPVQTLGSAPGSPMYVFFPDGDTQIGQVDFDPLDAGKACAVANSQTGITYYNNAATGQRLTFTSGNVILAA